MIQSGKFHVILMVKWGGLGEFSGSFDSVAIQCNETRLNRQNSSFPKMTKPAV